MQSAAKLRFGWAGIASSLLIVLLVGCASPAPAKPEAPGPVETSGAKPGTPAAGEAPPPSPAAAEPLAEPPAASVAKLGTVPSPEGPPPEDPLLSAARRLAPPETALLVLGLPEPPLPADPSSSPGSESRPPQPDPASAPSGAPSSAAAPTELAPPEPPVPAPAAALAPEASSSAPPSPAAPLEDPPPKEGARPSSPALASIKPPPAPQSAPRPAAALPKAVETTKPAAPASPGEAGTSAAPAPNPPPSLLPYIDPASAAAAPRRFAVELGQNLDLPFTGTGWTYLGEREGREGVRYLSRRFQDGGVLFSLGTSAPGEYTLRFQRQDLLKGLALDELVTLSVYPRGEAPSLQGPSGEKPAASTLGGAPTGSGSAGLPEPAAAPPAPTLAVATRPAAAPPQAASSAPGPSPDAALGGGPAPAGGRASAAASPAPAAASPAPASLPDSPEGLLRLARAELGAGHAAETLLALDRFLDLYPVGMDEVYLLLGRARELNGPYRDVKKAYESYKKVRDDFPQSSFWNDAEERIAYIERHYFEIR